MSVPQIPQDRMWTRISPAPIAGLGTSLISTTPLPATNAAFNSVSTFEQYLKGNGHTLCSKAYSAFFQD
jgi:hypothetical protein